MEVKLIASAISYLYHNSYLSIFYRGFPLSQKTPISKTTSCIYDAELNSSTGIYKLTYPNPHKHRYAPLCLPFAPPTVMKHFPSGKVKLS